MLADSLCNGLGMHRPGIAITNVYNAVRLHLKAFNAQSQPDISKQGTRYFVGDFPVDIKAKVTIHGFY